MRGKKRGLLIALSAGGDPNELSEVGLGIEHVDELMVRLAMKLLKEGHRLAFGGTLGDPTKCLTQHLIDTAQNFLQSEVAKHLDVNKPSTWPLVNYASWPNYESVDNDRRARLVGVCQFIDVDPKDVSKETLAQAKKTASEGRFRADALTVMRNDSSRDCDLRIVWGGKIKGSSGWIAGILEEVVSSLKAGKPVLILGGFGGCARLLADYLADANAPWPFADTDAFKAKGQGRLDPAIMADRYAEAEQLLAQLRESLGHDETINGVPVELFVKSLREETARTAIGFAAEAATTIQQAAK